MPRVGSKGRGAPPSTKAYRALPELPSGRRRAGCGLDSASMEAIRVGALLDDQKFDLRLTLVAGSPGLSRSVSLPRLTTQGMAMAGFTQHLPRERVPVFGHTEMSYLRTLSRERRI